MNPIDSAKHLMETASAHEAAGRYREAEKLCRRAVSALRHAGAEKTPRRWLVIALDSVMTGFSPPT